nr:putative holin-like toxin [Sporosarcina sp. ACRSM]
MITTDIMNMLIQFGIFLIAILTLNVAIIVAIVITNQKK